ncbi:cytidine deaminase [Candidatus Haliotispira prima]|uniref:Cytidine deaminase n=1 Tax=Candidatus Haliotispira prima TaxID=3034016 RepID=A0ABY8MKD6_9SPIO|nr:cytidine deaminase [Candidatus Haliotispira prima]
MADLTGRMTEQELVRFSPLYRAACAAYERAYAPYSNFPVGAAVLAENGQIYAGCNVENAAYPEGTCAEAGALAAMVLDGQQRARAVLVVAGGEEPVSPCGGCRQKLREFCQPEDMEVLLAGPLSLYRGLSEGLKARFSLAELLPQSFGPKHLDKASLHRL